MHGSHDTGCCEDDDEGSELEMSFEARKVREMDPEVWTGSSGATRGLSDHLIDGSYKLCCSAENRAITWVSPSWVGQL